MDKRNVQVRIVKTMENIRKKIREDLTTEDLAVWFGTKKKPKGSKQPKGPWVNICRKEDGKHPPCGRDKATGKSYPKCRAAGVAAKMTDEQKRAACAQKRRAEKKEPKVGKGNKPTMTSYKPRKEGLEYIIKNVIYESRFSSRINYPFIMKILTKMYGYEVNDIDTLKKFERTPYYTETKNSFDYMEQYDNYMKDKKLGYLKEATDSSSTGSYETPGFLAKNIPNMKQGVKTTYGGPGGKFVKIKSKCRKYPYCNQGAIDNPLELSDKYKGESSLSGEMELTPTYPKGYKGNIHLPKTKWINEGLEYSGRDVTKLPVIGKVITHPIGPYGEGEENVVEIIKGNNNEDVYVTDKWYKEHKRIPLIIHSKLVKDYIPSSINESMVLSFDDIKRIQEEGIKDKVLLGYDKVRDALHTIYYGVKTLGRFGYNFPSLYRDVKKHKGDKDALLLVVAKYKAELESYMDELFKKHPNYEMKRILNKLTAELKELENLTLDNFEKTPEKFTKHQTDILLKSYDVTPDGIKRKRGINGEDIDKLRNESKEVIPGGKSSGMSIYDIAKKHKISTQIAIMEWVKGIKVEMEHTNSKKIAREIAKDHLFEDIFYYRKLSKIEN